MGVRKNTGGYFHRYVGWQVEAAPRRIHCGDTRSGLRHVGKTIETRKFKRVKERNEWYRNETRERQVFVAPRYSPNET